MFIDMTRAVLLICFLFTLFYVQRAANTGWGREEDRSSRWDHESLMVPKKVVSFGHRGDFKPDTEEEVTEERVMDMPHIPALKKENAYDRREQKRSGRSDDSKSRRHDAENDCKREDKRSRTHDREKKKEISTTGMEKVQVGNQKHVQGDI